MPEDWKSGLEALAAVKTSVHEDSNKEIVITVRKRVDTITVRLSYMYSANAFRVEVLIMFPSKDSVQSRSSKTTSKPSSSLTGLALPCPVQTLLKNRFRI